MALKGMKFSLKNLWMMALLLVVAGCASYDFNTPYASGRIAREAEQCVPFARRVSGIDLRGDAHSWWHKASPHYKRGNRPQAGAVLVLSKTPKLRRGHLAVVKRVVNDREIDVTHTNWGSNKKTRAVIYDSMRVQDVSPKNDWTRLRFWNREANTFGLPYAAKGFIYQN